MLSMELVKTVKCKLEVDTEGREALQATLEQFASACNRILEVSQAEKTTNKVKLQHACYYSVREEFGLSANLAIRAIARVAEAAKRKPRKVHHFKPTSVSYDQRIFSIKTVIVDGVEQYQASLTTVHGRKKFMLKIGNYQRGLLKGQKPTSATLVKTKKGFYLNIVLSTPVDPPRGGGRVVGVDLGINNLATTSNGMRFSGKEAMGVRRRYSRLRSSLQAKGTASARRTLQQLSGKEQRWMKNENHRISRRIVNSLEPGDVIALEDLTHIRKRTKVRKGRRYVHQSWAFRQLQTMIEYKALERGIKVVYVDPRNSSKSCSRCGAIGNRQGNSFSCACGYRNHADYSASFNLASRGHALLAGPSSCGPKATPVEAKTAQAGLRSRAVASPRL